MEQLFLMEIENSEITLSNQLSHIMNKVIEDEFNL